MVSGLRAVLFKLVMRCLYSLLYLIRTEKKPKKNESKTDNKKTKCEMGISIDRTLAFVSILLFLSFVRIYLSVSLIFAFVLMLTFVCDFDCRCRVPCKFVCFFFLSSSPLNVCLFISHVIRFPSIFYPWLKSLIYRDVTRASHTNFVPILFGYVGPFTIESNSTA